MPRENKLTEYLQGAVECLKLLEVEPLELPQMQAIKADFIRQMDLGMAGQPESLAMIPTQLGELKKENLKEGDKALVIDAGGSGLKIGVYKVDDGKIVLEGENKEIAFPKTHWQAEDFFGYIAQQIQEQKISLEDIQGLGFIFSFPADAEKTAKGVDVQAKDKLTKDWTIDGLNKGGGVGEQLIKAMKKLPFQDAARIDNLKLSVMNDTVATLYAQEGAAIGGVVGTGFNLAVMLEGMVRNIEAGGFVSEYLLPNNLAKIFDQGTENKDKQLAEKQISGLIGGQLKEFIRIMALVEFLGPEWKGHLGKIDSRLVSHVLDSTQELKYMDRLLEGRKLTLWESNLLRPACEQLRDRSAQILASFLSAVAQKTGENDFVIPIDGSFFWKTPGYQEKLKENLRTLDPEKNYSFVGKDERLGAIGAARVVLTSESV